MNPSISLGAFHVLLSLSVASPAAAALLTPLPLPVEEQPSASSDCAAKLADLKKQRTALEADIKRLTDELNTEKKVVAKLDEEIKLFPIYKVQRQLEYQANVEAMTLAETAKIQRGESSQVVLTGKLAKLKKDFDKDMDALNEKLHDKEATRQVIQAKIDKVESALASKQNKLKVINASISQLESKNCASSKGPKSKTKAPPLPK